MSGALGTAIAGWAHLYNDNHAVNTTVTFAHFAGVLVGGGLALSADRAAFSRRGPGTDPRLHRWVVGALGLVFVSGILMMFADLDTYLTSAVFWIKMALVVALLANGYVRVRVEARGGVWLRRTSALSASLWLLILLAGTMLVS
jgi:hypothetical protein